MKRHIFDHDIPPGRVCAAADELLRAMRSRERMNTRVSMLTCPIRSGTQPPIGAFTFDEYWEAMLMLRRLGLVPIPNA